LFKQTSPREHVRLFGLNCKSSRHVPSLASQSHGNGREPLHVDRGMCKREEQTLRAAIPFVAVFVLVAGASMSLAQPANPSPGAAAACPPDAKGDPPTVGGRSSEPLSDKLAQSKGVICPPAGVDREMQVPPPGGGQLKVIPPPGTPGGDPNVQPK
jgi:hypothetical protein